MEERNGGEILVRNKRDSRAHWKDRVAGEREIEKHDRSKGKF